MTRLKNVDRIPIRRSGLCSGPLRPVMGTRTPKPVNARYITKVSAGNWKIRCANNHFCPEIEKETVYQ